MQLFPDSTIFIQIGNITITWYAILSISGFFVAYWLSRETMKKMKYDLNKFEDFLFYLLPIAYVGSRLWYCLFEWKRYINNPISILYIWEGGLAWHGGVIAGVILAIFFCKKNKMNILRFGDAVVPNLLIGQAIGRWGNFVNQEAYGPVVSQESLSWLPKFIQDGMYIQGQYHMPTFLYESMANIIGWILIRFVYNRYGRKKRGDLMYAYCIWSGMVRFYIESFRTDSLMIGPFKTAQLVSILLMVIGFLGIFGVYNKLFKNFYPFKEEKPVILFDVDGTLIDTVPLICASFKHVVDLHDPQRNMTLQDYKNIVGPALLDTIKILFPNEDEETIQRYADEYREYNHAHHDEMVSVLPGVVDMLEYCKTNGYDLGVVSNKVEKLVRHGLEHCGINQYFDVVICNEQLEKTKPDPEGLLKACELLNRRHDNVIYCGDAPGDVLAAKNMSAFSLAYVPDDERLEAIEKVKPCAIIKEWKQFIPLLEEEREWSDNSTL